jgi:hypothetical protein
MTTPLVAKSNDEKRKQLAANFKELKSMVAQALPNAVPKPADPIPRWKDGTPKGALLDASGHEFDAERALQDPQYAQANLSIWRHYQAKQAEDAAQADTDKRFNDQLAAMEDKQDDAAARKTIEARHKAKTAELTETQLQMEKASIKAARERQKLAQAVEVID